MAVKAMYDNVSYTVGLNGLVLALLAFVVYLRIFDSSPSISLLVGMVSLAAGSWLAVYRLV